MSTEADNPRMDVYGGVRWSAVATYGTQAVQFAITIVLARLLVPEDFGLMAMAFVFVGFLGVFRTLGFGQAVIQRKEIGDALTSSLFFVNIAAACLMALVSVASAPVVAWIYGDPRITPILAVLSITFLLSAPGIMAGAMLTRQMAFNRLAVVQILSTVVRGATAISLAVLGCGVWSLVWASLAASATGTALFHALSPWRPRLLFRWSEVRSVFGFGTNLTGFQVFNYFARQADNFIIGAFLGPIALGYYSLAYGIMLRPRDAVTNVLGRVLFPAFSRMQDDRQRLKDAYLRLCGAIAFITFPMMLGLLVVARPFVEVVLGAKWLPAVPLIWILAPLGMLQSVNSTKGLLLLALGRADVMMRLGVASGVLVVLSFLVGVPWGVVGIATSYTLMVALLTVPHTWLVFRQHGDMRLRDFYLALLPHLLTSGIMAVIALIGKTMLSLFHVPAHAVLCGTVSVGVLTYVVLVLSLRSPALNDFMNLFPRSRLRKWIISGMPQPGRD
ncbi:MAG: MOP flippase family protein [Planctomycetota bacterium]|jgi:PST family polysaccharide transporter